MKIFKYEIKDISAGVHLLDIEYLIHSAMVDVFTKTILDLKIHTIDDNIFYFISDMEDQIKMMNIFNDFNDESLKYEFGDYVLSYFDETDKVLNNIDEYDSIENFNDKNTLLEHYYTVFTPNTILEKVFDKGISSLTKHDKIILDESVRYK